MASLAAASLELSSPLAPHYSLSNASIPIPIQEPNTSCAAIRSACPYVCKSVRLFDGCLCVWASANGAQRATLWEQRQKGELDIAH